MSTNTHIKIQQKLQKRKGLGKENETSRWFMTQNRLFYISMSPVQIGK